jgi:hypothetical protein
VKYHATIEYGTKKHHWWNHSREAVLETVIVPFINGQVVLVKDGESQRLFNMKNATFLKVYRTRSSLKATDDKSVVQQLSEDSFKNNDCTAELISEVQSETTPDVPTSSLLQKAFQPPKAQVFVIMKFGDEVLDSAYEGAYKVVAQQFGLKCMRVDEVPDSGKISDQILEGIAESKYVIADLTGNRPNCYYETGFAHALGKELILIVRDDDTVHFDLAGHRFIRWRTETDLRKKLKERIQALEDAASRSEPVL